MKLPSLGFPSALPSPPPLLSRYRIAHRFIINAALAHAEDQRCTPDQSVYTQRPDSHLPTTHEVVPLGTVDVVAFYFGMEALI